MDSTLFYWKPHYYILGLNLAIVMRHVLDKNQALKNFVLCGCAHIDPCRVPASHRVLGEKLRQGMYKLWLPFPPDTSPKNESVYILA